MDQVREARLTIHLNDRHQIEAKQCKVSQIVLGQFLALQVRMDAAKAPKTAGCGTGTAEIRHFNALCRTDHNIFDLALAI
jgi:hypothetical protein